MILGVQKSASADEIRRAYRKLAKELHPDTNPGDKASEERFKKVTQAFKLLSNAESRGKFDRGEIDADGNERAPFHYRSRPDAGASQRGPRGQFEDIGDIFSELFGEGPGARQQRAQPRPVKGGDLRVRLQISLTDALKGAKRRINLEGSRSIEVKVPAGAHEGQVLRLKGQGRPGLQGGPTGDALVELKIKPHPYFKREGDDIRLDLPVSLKEAVRGGKVRAPTIDGAVEIRVPEGTTSGALLRLRGKGAPKADGQRGDQIIRLIIDIPNNDPALDGFIETWTPPSGYDPRKNLKG